MPSKNIFAHSPSSPFRMPSLLRNSTTALAKSYRSLSPLTKSKSEDTKARTHGAVKPPRRQISGNWEGREQITSDVGVRHPDTVERLPIARGGVVTGVNCTGCFPRPAVCSSYTSTLVPHLANQQTHASPILSETAPYENNRLDPVSPGGDEEPDSEDSSAGSSFSTDKPT